MNEYPTRLELPQRNLLIIEWSDGERREYRASELRGACPCASCREKQTQKEEKPMLLPVLSPEEARPLEIQGMRPVGNYAYTIEFSDGHSTGIYTFELLRSLGKRQQ